jgi:hypothetical protein
MGLISAYALRKNNVQMIHLRDEVILADREGRDVNKPLDDLRQHVYIHMNANLTSGDTAIRPPIQLKETYDKLVRGERKRISDINKQVMADATKTCERRFGAGLLATGRVQCVQSYLTSHSVKEKEIPKELYQFDFVAPIWSPDLAGWSLLLAGIFLLLFVVRFSLEKWMRHSLE